MVAGAGRQRLPSTVRANRELTVSTTNCAFHDLPGSFLVNAV